ncbi:MAG: site-specific integrase [Actinomycetota bacterium]|nr:site-specific integrase [Actinomycetota bacterium]
MTATFPTRRQAQEWLNEQLGAAQRGESVRRRTLTVDDYLAGWLEHREAVVGRRRTTMNRYRSLLAHHVSPTLGHVEVQQVTTADVDELYAAMIRAGLARATVRQLHAVLGKALSDAEAKGVIVRNPVRHASPPSMAGATDEMTVWTPAELAQFFELAAEHRLASLWRLAAMTGMRRGEVCGLRWSAVDLTQGVVRVERTRTTAGGAEIVESEPKSQRSRRVITLDRETTRVLSSHRRAERELEMSLRGSARRGGEVFTNPATAEAMRPDSVSRAWERLVQRLPLPTIRFHDLRHTHATHLLAAGVDPLVVSRRLGHANVAFTLNTYGHLLPGQDGQAAQVVGDLVDGTGA